MRDTFDGGDRNSINTNFDSLSEIKIAKIFQKEQCSNSTWPKLPPWAIEEERKSWGKRLHVLEWEDDCNVSSAKHSDDYRSLNGWKV